MSTEELRDKIQVAISKPDNQYKMKYARTEDKKYWLHVWMTDTRKSSEEVIQLLKRLNIIT